MVIWLLVHKLINNKEYYFTSEGVMVRGWHKENDKWKYYSPKKMSVYGRTFVEGEKVTGWLPINDKWYYIAEDGYMVTGIIKLEIENIFLWKMVL